MAHTHIVKDDDPYFKDVCETIKMQIEAAEEDAKPCDESQFEAGGVVSPEKRQQKRQALQNAREKRKNNKLNEVVDLVQYVANNEKATDEEDKTADGAHQLGAPEDGALQFGAPEDGALQLGAPEDGKTADADQQLGAFCQKGNEPDEQVQGTEVKPTMFGVPAKSN